MPPTDTAKISLASLLLKIDGQDASKDLMDSLLECTVETTLHLPDVCHFRLHESGTTQGGLHWIDGSAFDFGKTVEVQGGYENDMQTIFYGEIIGMEVDLEADAPPTLNIQCLDHSHRLHRGRKSRSFVNVTDSDLVNKLAGEGGLSAGTIESTSTVHDWVFQKNQTNWEFLTERTRRNGHRLFVNGQKKLNSKKVVNSGDATVEMKWGEDLTSFRPRVEASQQVDKVTVRGWDRLTKQAIVGQSTTPNGVPQIGTSSNGGSVAQSAFGGSATMMVNDRHVFTQDEATQIAQSIHDDIGGEFIEADGVCQGNPAVQPGCMVKITNIGTKFSGSYQVTSVTHVYNPSKNYTTHFSITGKRPDSVLDILHDKSGGARSSMGANIIIAVVTDNKDDKGLGRVKVKYPSYTEDDASFWAAIAAPMAGAGRGFYFLPEVNDEVLVAFEHGDIHRPYIIGALWNGKDNPMEKNSEAVGGDGKVNHRIIKTRIGHTILLDDLDGKGEMKMTSCHGHVVTINDKDNKIESKSKDGHTVTLDDQNGKIVVVDKTNNNKITITSSDNSMKMECNGNFDIDSKGKITVKGSQGIEMSTPMQFKATADAGMDLESQTTMKLNANATMDVTASGPTTIKGAIVQIN